MIKEETGSSGGAMPDHFICHYDSAYEWLEVWLSTLIALKLERQISTKSFQKEGKVYLEENLDAILFERAYLNKIGRQGGHKYFILLVSFEYDGNISPIRGFPKYSHLLRRESQFEG